MRELARHVLGHLIHRLAHWCRRNACGLALHEDGWYLHCDGCGATRFYAPAPPHTAKGFYGDHHG